MMLRWSGCGAAVVVLGLLAACSSGSHSSGSGSSPDSDPVTIPQGDCVPDESCDCEAGYEGVTVCDGDKASCECTKCPALELHDAPSVKGCGGEPFGTWRLAKMDLGTSKLTLSSFGMPVGDCDVSTTLTDELPNALMTLSDGGDAEYYAEGARTKVSWSESCVTNKVSQFSCGAKAWTGVSNCKLSCDTCSCDSNLGSAPDDEGTWQRTASTLTLAPWGTAISFDYCLKDGVLELSSDGIYLAYQAVYTLSTPEPCAGRSAAQCTAGSGCSLGACVGGADCETAGSEGECLTIKGCSWDAKQCQGEGQLDCTLADFGKVPGCEFLDKPLVCSGKRPACATLDNAGCADVEGCSLSQTGHCSGPELSCENFGECLTDYCQGDDFDCTGTTSCSAFDSKSECALANTYYVDPLCTWQQSACEGTPVACEKYSPEDCASVPGCELAAAP